MSIFQLAIGLELLALTSIAVATIVIFVQAHAEKKRSKKEEAGKS